MIATFTIGSSSDAVLIKSIINTESTQKNGCDAYK